MATEAELKAAGEQYIPKDYDPALYKLRHSLAHVLAQAVVERFPQAKPTIGPPIEYGFYYDFDLDVNPTDTDLNWIADRMRQLIKAKHAFKVREISADEGRELFKDNPYKLELIEGLTKGQDEYGNAGAARRPSPFTSRTPSPTCAAGRTSRPPGTSTRRASRSPR